MTLSGSLAPSVSGRKEVAMPPNKQRIIEIRYGYWNKKVKVDIKEKVTVMSKVKGAQTFRSGNVTRTRQNQYSTTNLQCIGGGKQILPLRLWHTARQSKSSGEKVLQTSIFDN